MCAKYLELASTQILYPLAFKTLGPICEEGLSFLDNLRQRLLQRKKTRKKEKKLKKLKSPIKNYSFSIYHHKHQLKQKYDKSPEKLLKITPLLI